MTNRPPDRGPPPRFDSYRPAEERTGQPQHPGQPRRPGPPPQGYGHPQQGYGYPPPDYPPGPQHAQPYPRAQAPAPRPQQRSGFSLGSMLFYGVLGLIAMAAGAAAFALTALPADFVRDRVTAAVKERTGRDLIIAGPASFTVFPSVGVSLADVSLSAGPGFDGAKPLVTMEALDLAVGFWPLLQREVRVEKLVLKKPVFNLEVDRNGQRSWDFASADGRGAWTRVAQAASPDQDTATDAAPQRAARGGGMFRVDALKLDDVRIESGTLHHRDARSGDATTISAIDAEMKLAALAEPLHAKGNLDWKGRTVRFDGALNSLADVMESRPAKLDFHLGAEALDATYKGSATLADAITTEGILSAKSPSARTLLGWFGVEVPSSQGFGPLAAKGLLHSAPGEVTYSTAEITLDRTTALGRLAINTRGARPLLKADLKLSELDLNLYASDGTAPPARAATPPKKAAPTGGGNAQSIEDLLDRAEEAPPGPRVKGYTKRAGWSEEPYSLGGLGQLDADAKLSIGKLTVSTIRLDQSDLTVALKNRVMKTTFNRVDLYQGTGKGTVTLDGTAGNAASVSANLALDGIAAQPLLKDAADIDRLTGTGRIALALAGRGANEREIVETLNGKVDFAFADGAIVGINVAELVRNLSKGNLGGLKASPTGKTDFSELTSTWTVKAGVAENQDLQLASPLLRLTGSGRVGLPPRNVDYTLRPKIVANLTGQGGARDLSGLEIPVRMHGSWDDPKFTPDLASIAKDPNKAVDAVKEIGKQFKGKKADEIVNELLGGESGGASGESAKEKGKKLLDQFLNR